MEMSKRNRSIKIGVLALAGLATFLILFIFFTIGSNKKIFSSKYSLYMFLTDIQGLDSGANITLSGLKVGVVGSISFISKEEQKGILIELKIQDKYAPLITASSVASIKTMGVLGDKYINITMGDLQEAPLDEGMFVKSKPMLDFDLLLDAAFTLFQGLDTTFKNIQEISNTAAKGEGFLGTLLNDQKTKDNFIQSMRNLRNLTHQILKGEGTLGKLVQDTILYVTLQKTTHQLDTITEKIHKGEGSLGKLVNDPTLYTKLQSVSTKADSLLLKLQGQGTMGKLLKDEQLYNELVTLTRSLHELIEDMKKNPKKYVKFSLF